MLDNKDETISLSVDELLSEDKEEMMLEDREEEDDTTQDCTSSDIDNNAVVRISLRFIGNLDGFIIAKMNDFEY